MVTKWDRSHDVLLTGAPRTRSAVRERSHQGAEGKGATVHTRSRRLAPAAAMIALVALTAACGGDDGGSTGAGEKVTLRVSTFGKFGYTDLYKQYMKDHTNVTIVETAEGDLGKYNTQLIQRIAAGVGRRRRRRHRGGPGRQLPPERRQVRQPPAAREQRAQGQLPAVEVHQRHDGRRQDHDRPRHGRRRTGHVLPRATCSRRPGCRPTATRSASCGRPGTTTSPPASATSRASRTTRPIRRQRHQHLQLDPHAVGRPDLLRPRGRPGHRQQPRCHGRRGTRP